jgi:hypothetical protein
MHESMISPETWTYECLACLHEWHEEFEVGHCADGHGGEVVYYRRNGHRCTSPWAELFCPSCGSYDVKILPPGRPRSQAVPPQRHGELEMIFKLRRLHAY